MTTKPNVPETGVADDGKESGLEIEFKTVKKPKLPTDRPPTLAERIVAEGFKIAPLKGPHPKEAFAYETENRGPGAPVIKKPKSPPPEQTAGPAPPRMSLQDRIQNEGYGAQLGRRVRQSDDEA